MIQYESMIGFECKWFSRCQQTYLFLKHLPLNNKNVYTARLDINDQYVPFMVFNYVILTPTLNKTTLVIL